MNNPCYYRTRKKLKTFDIDLSIILRYTEYLPVQYVILAVSIPFQCIALQ